MDERPWSLGSIDLGELVVGIIAVALDEASTIPFEKAARMHSTSTRRVVEHYDRWVRAAMSPVIRDHSPEVAGLRLPASRIKHRRPGLIHEDPIRTFQSLSQMIDHRTQMEAGAPNPVAECCPIQCDPLPGVDLGLAVKRGVVTELGHDDLRDQRFCRQTTGHDMFRSMGLDHSTRAAPASVFRTAGDEHTELSRHDIEPFGHILADPGHLTTSARTERGLGFDDPLDPR